MAAAIENGTMDAQTWSKPGRIASIGVISDLAGAEATWRAMENAQHSCTPYQRFDFVSAWQRNVGAREGLTPFIVIAYDAERRPLMLLPLAVRHAYGARCAGFMGGKHSTFNMALWDKEFAAAWCANVELRFEKRLVAIEDRADQPVVAHFSDGASAEGDFIIGADGVHSAVRGHVIPDGPKPFDTGSIGFGGFVPHPVIEHAPIGRRVVTTFGRSGFFGYGFCSSDPADGVMWWSTQPSHGVDAATYRAMTQDQLRQHLRNFHAGWHDPILQILDAAENIVVTDTLDVATLPTWSRKRTLLIGDAAHATSPHAGQGASLALEDAMRLGRLMQTKQETSLTFQNFEAERRPRAEKIVALARRNGNSKREFSPTGAWIRNRMMKLLLPLGARTMDFMYAYDPRAA